MKLTTYKTVNANNNDLLTELARTLKKGYDVYPVLFSEESRTIYRNIVRYCHNIEKCGISDEDILNDTNWSFITEDIIPAGYKPEKFVKLSTGHLAEIVKGIGIVDVTAYTNADFDKQQMIELRTGLIQGVDVSKYARPEITAENMRILRNFSNDGIDISKLVNTTNALLYRLGESYENYGSAVIENFQNHREFYEKLVSEIETENKNRELFLIFMAGQIWNVFEPPEHTELINLNAEQFYALAEQVFENIKEKIIDAFLIETDRHRIDRQHDYITTAVDVLKELQYKTSSVNVITKLTGQEVRENYLWYFVLMFSRNQLLFERGLSILKQTGIGPDKYIKNVEDVRRTRTQETLDRIKNVMIDRLQKVGVKVNRKTITDELLMSLCESFKGTEYAEPQVKIYVRSVDDAVRTYLILRYLQKGINISELIPHINDIRGKEKYGFSNSDYVSIYKRLADILLEHNINLFPSITTILINKITGKAERDFIQIRSVQETLEYIYHFLGKPQGLVQHKCAELLIEHIYNNNCFNDRQIRQLYYGILHGVDVSVYAKTNYPVDVMSAIREGLEQGVDLTPYMNDSTLSGTDLRYQLRTLTGMTPQDVKNNTHLQKKI